LIGRRCQVVVTLAARNRAPLTGCPRMIYSLGHIRASPEHDVIDRARDDHPRRAPARVNMATTWHRLSDPPAYRCQFLL